MASIRVDTWSRSLLLELELNLLELSLLLEDLELNLGLDPELELNPE
jgi:hypothetical protein